MIGDHVLGQNLALAAAGKTFILRHVHNNKTFKIVTSRESHLRMGYMHGQHTVC